MACIGAADCASRRAKAALLKPATPGNLLGGGRRQACCNQDVQLVIFVMYGSSRSFAPGSTG
jgi:hypothetical protein